MVILGLLMVTIASMLVVGSGLVNGFIYLAMLAAPFPFMRYGSTASPRHTLTKSFGLRY